MKFTTCILAVLLTLTAAVSASAIPNVGPDFDEASTLGCSAGAKCSPNNKKICATKPNGQKVMLDCNNGCWYVIPGAICK